MFVMSLLPSGNREKAVIRLMASWLDSRLSCSTGSLGKVVQPCSPELSGTPQGLTAVPAAEYEGAQGAQVQPEGCVVPCLGGQQVPTRCQGGALQEIHESPNPNASLQIWGTHAVWKPGHS
mmetsp:Transcript_24048/g.52595  ORF Transcript_24048/g.52595 Transcript_24048/m.52595 type:complete len:121 (-) Transcript_24048:148-510(-)